MHEITASLKLVMVPGAPTGVTRKQLQHHLEQVHAPLVMSYPEVGGRFIEYIHHYVVDGAADPVLEAPVLEERDDITVIVLPSVQDMEAVFTSSAYLGPIQTDEENFLARERSWGLIARPFVIKTPKEMPYRLFHLRRVSDPATAESVSAVWRERVGNLLADNARSGPVAGYVHNLVQPIGGGDPPYHMIDELSIADLERLPQFGSLLRDAEQGLFDDAATASLVTRARVFIAPDAA